MLGHPPGRHRLPGERHLADSTNLHPVDGGLVEPGRQPVGLGPGLLRRVPGDSCASPRVTTYSSSRPPECRSNVAAICAVGDWYVNGTPPAANGFF